MKSLFVTGTDTEVGKTVVTGLIADYLLRQNKNIITQKWVQTGFSESCSDVRGHCRISGPALNFSGYKDQVMPYRFRLAASPHLAARREGRTVRRSKIISSFTFLARRFDSVLVEGCGGALVPLNQKTLFLDVAAQLSLAAVIVVSNKLGAINHALLTIEAVRARRMPIIGLIFNSVSSRGKKIIREDNPAIITAFTGIPVLAELPYSCSVRVLRSRFIPAGEMISRYLEKRG